jgi:hypothetical protein
LFYDGKRHLSQQETIFCPRNNIDTLRNPRSTRARLLMFITLAGFANFLEQIGPFSPATDMARMIEITARYRITLHLWVAHQRSGFHSCSPKQAIMVVRRTDRDEQLRSQKASNL